MKPLHTKTTFRNTSLFRSHLARALLALSLGTAGAAASSSEPTDDNFLHELMALSKMAGLCGAFKQMANFQEATQMAGGEEFFVRFVQTESARLGYEMDEMLENCTSVVAKYSALYEATSLSPTPE